MTNKNMYLSNIDLIIFDCDGVLIDSEYLFSATISETLKDLGIDLPASEAHRKFTGTPMTGIMEMCRTEYGVTDPATLARSTNERFYERCQERLRAMPGIEDAISRVKRPKCVASNSTLERLRNSLGMLDLWNAFAPDIFSAEQVSRPKPAPDLLLLCAERFKARPFACVMIDDSAHGMAAAVAAGMIPIGFIDPKDPRQDRHSTLSDHGAHAVALGAGAILDILESIDRQLAEDLQTGHSTEKSFACED
ncbi:HAD-IA family hydrolase [Shinella sp. S4-D37]|uniref:HAD family hydrolase n=1 Tax=Shinella sp. S4-D37 TaxID=3161999 RepID=UPI0034678881